MIRTARSLRLGAAFALGTLAAGPALVAGPALAAGPALVDAPASGRTVRAAIRPASSRPAPVRRVFVASERPVPASFVQAVPHRWASLLILGVGY